MRGWLLLLLALAGCSGGLPAGTGLPAGGQRVILGYQTADQVEQARALLGARRVEVDSGVRAALVELPPQLSPEEARARLRPLRLRYVEEEATRSFRPLPSPLTAAEVPALAWHLGAVQATAAWERAQGRGIVVAVLDTGMDLGHPEFAGRVLPGLDAGTGEAIAPGSDQSEGDVHGTHVAALAVGGSVGTAPQARLLPVRIFTPDYVGDFKVAQALRWSVDNGAKVVNLSFAGAAYSYVLHDAVNYALERGVIVVAAAGNQGGTAQAYPAALPGVLAVGAANGRGEPASFSNRGPWVNIYAPGVRIYSAVPGGGYGLLSGTSMAAPIVAGLAALLKEAYPLEGAYAARVRLSSLPGPNAQAAMAAAAPPRAGCLWVEVRREGSLDPVPYAALGLVGPEAYWAQTDERGAARFLEITPGSYRLTVATSSDAFKEIQVDVTPLCYAPTRILLP